MKKYTSMLLVVFTLMLFLSSCSTRNDKPVNSANIQLSKLLPSKEGYTWFYSGFAEYGHVMKLNSIDKKGGMFTFNIKGQVDDPSGGEAKNRDYGLQLSYIINNGVLTQLKKETTMQDSKFDKIELIRLPLEKGTKWVQTVKAKDNTSAVLDCVIEDINTLDGVKIYTIIYQERDSFYYEKRNIKEGVGVLLFEKIFVTDDQRFPAGYYLNEEASGYIK